MFCKSWQETLRASYKISDQDDLKMSEYQQTLQFLEACPNSEFVILWNFPIGHESGVLCRSYEPVAGRNATESEELFEKLTRENCSLFHSMLTYTDLQESFSIPQIRQSLIVKVMNETCPFILKHTSML